MADSNPNVRLEAFCDGVFAIALTLLVLELRIPPSATIHTTRDLWLALAHILPSIFAFLLSFATIFITWANHHAALKLLDKTSSLFIYANGFLLLPVVLIPFTTGLLGEYLLTDAAAPAVALYAAVNGLQAIGWIFLTQAALKPRHLTRDETSTLAIRRNRKNGYFALATYTACTILAFWFPLGIAFVITAIWVGWLVTSIRTKAAVSIAA
jgi:uncharacterized membrane protein